LHILSREMVAASAGPLVLSILKQGDSYGYAIIQRVRELSDGELQWADGMLYPILHRLEKKGLIESYTGQAESGRKRKYYRLKPEGSEALIEQRAQWNRLHSLLMRLEGETPCLT